mgnify:CR=1 FL=1
MELPTRYDFKNIEPKIIKFWESIAKVEKQKGKNYFIAIFAPPNITGSLHMGHALGYSAEDIILRLKRMQGYKIVWIPGTDHAGIATQNQVEKYLLKEKGLTRQQIGKEKFVQEVWNWKKRFGNIIIEQFKKLGIIPDWSRLRFTLDKNYIKEVEKSFYEYYKKGLVYRALRPVNYCFRCETSLSDLEVERKEVIGNLYYLRYPLKDNLNQYILVATSRPETILGDVALAVNPEDERYSQFIGKTAILPLIKRELPIIADKRVDPKLGTGVLKVTPAHSLIDFEIASRHNLPLIPVIDKNGKILDNVGIKKYAGLTVKEARLQILEDLKNEGLYEGVETLPQELPICYRCSQEIDIIPSKEWFLSMKNVLANLALKAVSKKLVKIIPTKYIKPYRLWLLNVRDWCISRKIWWGQTLPVYYCKKCGDDVYVVSLKTVRKRCPKCKNNSWERTDEVFDTWFSSAIWPFAILYSKKEKKWYPADLAVSAKDILHLWDTRMIFSGMFFKKKVPFKTLFINPTVLTKEGKRMSKSLGTGVDPLDLIEKYGADAVRFGLMWQIMKQQDVRFDEVHIENAQKFVTKIWNAVRFTLIKLKEMKPQSKLSSNDKAILNQLKRTIKKVNLYLEKFEFGLAARELYSFFWNKVCDVYLESCKGETKNSPQVLKYVIESSLKILHPFLPFITQELWFILGHKTALVNEKWPTL